MRRTRLCFIRIFAILLFCITTAHAQYGRSNDKASNLIMYVLLALLGNLILFLLLREIVCWYLKINKRIELMNELICELHSLSQKLSDSSGSIILEQTTQSATPRNRTAVHQMPCGVCGLAGNKGSICECGNRI